MRAQVNLVFDKHPDPLDPRLISEYLYLLTGCMTAAKELNLDLGKNGQSILANSDAIKRKFESVSPLEWQKYFSIDTNTQLSLQHITSKSPLDLFFIVSAGSIGLITLAVILSGGVWHGKVLGCLELKAKLPPLGEGIKNLRESLGLLKKDRLIGFGLQSVTVKLSKDEYEMLMTPTTGTGGFQHFIKKLQTKTDRTTRVITLSVEDLDRIQIYKSNPKAGGFQARYQKIFGRHLN